MSTLKVDGIRSNSATSDAITMADNGTCTANITNKNHRNLLINGEFLIDQRKQGATYSCNPSGGSPVYGTVDRWQFKNYSGEAGRYDVSQSTDTPNHNFKKSLKIDVTTAMGTPSGNNYASFAQNIEAQNVAHLGFGSSASKQVTLQFWIKSTKTGAASVGLQRDDNGRLCLKTYTINVSDTWEYKTLTFPADTSGGIVPADNGRGIRVDFVLFSARHSDTTGWHDKSHFESHSSQVNLIDSTSNNIFFAGIQLEEGAIATDFIHEDYGTILLKCQRYYAEAGTVFANGTPQRYHNTVSLPVEMRALPSRSNITIDSGSGGNMYPTWDRGGTANSKRQFYQGANNSAISNAIVAFESEL